MVAANQIAKKYEDAQSLGRPKKMALRMVVNKLNIVFDKYHSIEPLDEDHEEYDGRTDPIQKGRIDFIRECLSLDSITCPKKDDALLQLLYTDDTPPNEKLDFKTF